MRTGQAAYPGPEAWEGVDARIEPVHITDLKDARMQNVALLGRLAALKLIPGVDAAVMRAALEEGTPAKALEGNLAVFKQATELAERKPSA